MYFCYHDQFYLFTDSSSQSNNDNTDHWPQLLDHDLDDLSSGIEEALIDDHAVTFSSDGKSHGFVCNS